MAQGAAVSITSGIAKMAGAITKTDTRHATDALAATNNPVAQLAVAASGGNLNAGEKAGTFADVALIGP